MRFTDRIVQTDSGAKVPLSSFWEHQAVAIVFLRHLGCIFCKLHVAEIQKHPELNIVFVCLGAPSNAAVFKAIMHVNNTFICDPDKVLYDEAGLRKANLGQLVNLHVVRKGFEASLAGHKNARSAGDPMILGGTFVVQTTGEITFEHRANDAADNASIESIQKALIG